MKSDKKKPLSDQNIKLEKVGQEQPVLATGDGTPPEFYGPEGPEPTRYGDWEQKGRCTDF